ncbi:MAG: polysaccharide deacetylase family protein [Nocardioides sp.]|uniref:polysaccharide deacetylase family protein n=1 Tax=Nocardioides sp. TaxID=35761 RepID=UPI0039E54B22
MSAPETASHMTPLDRIAYDPISKRATLSLPDGKRVAVWVIVNIEEWSIHETMPRTVLTPPAGGQPVPDIPNWAWHEYGNRVGFWRLLHILDSLAIKAVLAINGRAVDAYPDIAEAAIERGWEFIGHGLTQKNMQRVADEADDIAKTTAAIAAATGRPPRGWLGPGLTETWETPDLLAEAGYEYVCDWVLDDQPVMLTTRDGGAIASVPYTQECNDVAMMLIQHHPAGEYERRAIDQFDQLLADAESAGSARVMALVVHPYIMGAPHRARYVKGALAHIAGSDGAVFMTGEEILDWYRTAAR